MLNFCHFCPVFPHFFKLPNFIRNLLNVIFEIHPGRYTYYYCGLTLNFLEITRNAALRYKNFLNSLVFKLFQNVRNFCSEIPKNSARNCSKFYAKLIRDFGQHFFRLTHSRLSVKKMRLLRDGNLIFEVSSDFTRK